MKKKREISVLVLFVCLCVAGITFFSVNFAQGDVKLSSPSDIPAFYENLKEANQAYQNLVKSSKLDEAHKLESQVDKEWHEAIGQISKMGEQAVPALMNILNRRSIEIKSFGMLSVYPYTFPEYALAAIGKPAVPSLVSALSKSSADEQKRILFIFKLMGEQGFDAGEEILNMAKYSPEEKVKNEAGIALGYIKYEPAKNELLRMLKGQQKQIISSDILVLTLGRLGGDEAVDVLVWKYNNTNTNADLKKRIVEALGNSNNNKKASSFLLGLAKGNSRDTWGPLAKTGIQEAIPVFEKKAKEASMKKGEEDIFVSVITDLLPSMYKNGGNKNALIILQGLAKGDKQVLKRFNPEMDDTDYFRFCAIRGLRYTDSAEAIKTLNEIYTNSATDQEFKKYAETALKELGAK